MRGGVALTHDVLISVCSARGNTADDMYIPGFTIAKVRPYDRSLILSCCIGRRVH